MKELEKYLRNMEIELIKNCVGIDISLLIELMDKHGRFVNASYKSLELYVEENSTKKNMYIEFIGSTMIIGNNENENIVTLTLECTDKRNYKQEMIYTITKINYMNVKELI